MNVMKYSGYFLFFTGVLHNLIGFAFGWPILLEMHQDNWYASTVVDGQLQFNREAIVWFIGAGFFWMIFGWMLQKALNEGFVPPVSFGWSLLAMGVIFAVIMPVSGAYLFIIQGFLLIYGVHRASNRAPATV